MHVVAILSTCQWCCANIYHLERTKCRTPFDVRVLQMCACASVFVHVHSCLCVCACAGKGLRKLNKPEDAGGGRRRPVEARGVSEFEQAPSRSEQ